MTDEELLKAKRKAKADYMREWMRKNPDKAKANRLNTWQRHGKKYEDRRRIRYKIDPSLTAAATQRSREWRAKNSEHRKAYMRDYIRKNSAKLVARASAWKKANPDRAKTLAVHSGHLRRTRMVKTTELQREQARKMMLRERKKKSHVCYYCKSRFKGAMHWDHVIPVSKGGGHSPDNLCVACPNCNLSKADRELKHVETSANLLLPI